MWIWIFCVGVMMMNLTDKELWILKRLLEQKVEYGGTVELITDVIKILDKVDDAYFNGGEISKTK